MAPQSSLQEHRLIIDTGRAIHNIVTKKPVLSCTYLDGHLRLFDTHVIQSLETGLIYKIS